jgi:antitoxin HicB
MPHYIALIHKDADSCYGVSFPDWPGVVTAGDTIDEAVQQAVEVLAFAAEDWETPDGVNAIPKPRSGISHRCGRCCHCGGAFPSQS